MTDIWCAPPQPPPHQPLIIITSLKTQPGTTTASYLPVGTLEVVLDIVRILIWSQAKLGVIEEARADINIKKLDLHNLILQQARSSGNNIDSASA